MRSRFYTTEATGVYDQVQQAIHKVRDRSFLLLILVLTFLFYFQIVTNAPCVVFMKGTPSAPQCGFSGAVVKILNTVGALVSLMLEL